MDKYFKFFLVIKMTYQLKHFKSYIFLLILTISNYWVWQIFSNNLVLGGVLLLIELGLFILITQKNLRKRYQTILFLSGLFFLSLGAIFVKGNFDQTLLVTSPTEISILMQRHGYLADGLGKIFTNKYVLHYYKDYSMAVGKYERNIFYSLDPNLYFFRSHPREKAGIDEYEKKHRDNDYGKFGCLNH